MKQISKLVLLGFLTFSPTLVKPDSTHAHDYEAIKKEIVDESKEQQSVGLIDAFGSDWAQKHFDVLFDDEELEDVINIGVIIKGEEFAKTRTPVFVRSLFSHTTRTLPIHLYVLCDEDGKNGFRDVLVNHRDKINLPTLEGDNVQFVSIDDLEQKLKLVSKIIHPFCNARNYGYLFYKLVFPNIFPSVNHLIVLDPDIFVMHDITDLWYKFNSFGKNHVLGVVSDQSDGYYYRLSNPEDEHFSPGWEGAGVGLNFGVVLLHAARIRRIGFVSELAKLTHEGARLMIQGKLTSFCSLQEQDALIYARLKRPEMMLKLDCVYNYMPLTFGERGPKAPQGHPFIIYDGCYEIRDDDRFHNMLDCGVCGQKVRLLHFPGAMQKTPLFKYLEAEILSSTGEALIKRAKIWAAAPLNYNESVESAEVDVSTSQVCQDSEDSLCTNK